MPDWSYHPLLRPLLRALPPPARARALDLAGAFSATRVGGRLVKGAAAPDPRLAVSTMGLTFASPVGAGVGTPHAARLVPLVSRLGVGFVEREATHVNPDALHIPRGVQRGCRIVVGAGDVGGLAESMARWAPSVDFFTLAPAQREGLDDETIAKAATLAAGLHRPFLVVIDGPLDAERIGIRAGNAIANGASGIVWKTGAAPSDARVIQVLRSLRARHPEATVIAETPVEVPGDAVALLDAGASLVTVGAGFAQAGPGLPKRVNETLVARLKTPAPAGAWRGGWMGHLLLGLGMIFSGILAWIVAITRVVLPYDESFVGMTREELAAINGNMLDFLAHDRITLAGTMVSIGILYTMLAWHGQRRGARWARWTITASAAVGFASFFLFLGFGYFDPLHALNAVVLLPFFVWGLRQDASEYDATRGADVVNDAAWRAAQWGQLGFIAIGVGLVLAGATIAIVGSTSVFVPQDLAFLNTTADALADASPRVIPLVAHDRAGFGGALVADGVAVFLLALWGIRRGARWVWWALLTSGAVGFVAAVGIHVRVGYLDVVHLAPVVVALVLFATSLVALRPYLTRA